eukprot:4095014-Alexandrium_andersonii.AAC.1
MTGVAIMFPRSCLIAELETGGSLQRPPGPPHHVEERADVEDALVVDDLRAQVKARHDPDPPRLPVRLLGDIDAELVGVLRV